MSESPASLPNLASQPPKIRVAGKKCSFPLTNGDIRPDPKVLSPAERMSEFGRLMLRAMERRRNRQDP